MPSKATPVVVEGATIHVTKTVSPQEGRGVFEQVVRETMGQAFGAASPFFADALAMSKVIIEFRNSSGRWPASLEELLTFAKERNLPLEHNTIKAVTFTTISPDVLKLHMMSQDLAMRDGNTTRPSVEAELRLTMPAIVDRRPEAGDR